MIEKRNGQIKLCQRIKGSDGQFKYDIDSILDDQLKLYIKLFTSEGWDKNSSAKINWCRKEWIRRRNNNRGDQENSNVYEIL